MNLVELEAAAELARRLATIQEIRRQVNTNPAHPLIMTVRAIDDTFSYGPLRISVKTFVEFLEVHMGRIKEELRAAGIKVE